MPMVLIPGLERKESYKELGGDYFDKQQTKGAPDKTYYEYRQKSAFPRE